MPRAVTIAVLVTVLGSPLLAQPAITFAPDRVAIAGLSPSARVAWLSVAREPGKNWITTVVRREGIAAADAKGQLDLPYDSDISGNSAWAAVDLGTGMVAFGVPEAASWHVIEPTAREGVASRSGARHLFEDERPFLEAMLVRPGEGAWGLSVGDGGASDGDAVQDGVIRAAVAALRPIADSAAPPAGARGGDVIVAIDPERLEAYAYSIGQAR